MPPVSSACAYSEAVNKALQDVIPSSNPLDDPDFDALVYMNECFPDEGSLRDMDKFLLDLEQDLARTNQELRDSVRQQVEAGGVAAQKLSSAQSAIGELFEKVSEIQRMADESESMVTEICSEISSLDTAKKGLTDSISALKSLRDVNRFLDELKAASDAKPPEQDVAADCIRRLSDILNNVFKDYLDVPRIAEFDERFAREKKISSQIALQQLKEADLSGELSDAQAIIDACAVLEACGDKVREEGIAALVQHNLEKYQRAFPDHADDAKLEKMERRFAWFRRLLKVYEQNLQDYVPRTWCVPQELAVEYCLATRQAVERQLEETQLNIEIIVRILQKTVDFERDLTQRMQKLERNGKKYKYEGFITSCFEHKMEAYVEHENERMRSAMAAFLKEENMTDLLASSGGDSGQPATLRAGLGLFMYVRESLDKATNFGNNRTLANLYNTWANNLVSFAHELCARIPSKSAEEVDDANISVLINTADWSQDQATRLAEAVRQKLDEDLAKKIDEDTCPNEFRSVINKGILQLITNLNKRLTPALNEMMAVPWSAIEEVGDQSPYVTELCEIMSKQFLLLGQRLQPALYRYLCDKFVTIFIPRYVSCFYKLKKLSPAACRQLLLDIQVLKAELPKIPNIGKSDRFKDKELKSYNALLRAHVERGEAILKFVGCELPVQGNALADHYVELVGKEASVLDFGRLMELKGLVQKEYKAQMEYLVKTKGLQQTSERDASAYRPPAAVLDSTSEATKEISETLKRWKGRWGDGMNRFKDVSMATMRKKD